MVITLLTDFGDRDSYVGVMKGVIATINPTIVTIDITHQIPPQDIMAARFNLMNAAPYYPRNSIHLVVVDPGVGGTRRAIAIHTAEGLLVGPDNGVFSGLLQQWPPLEVVELTNRAYWRTTSPSLTFHGRDIFAPVAAHLARGIPLRELGQPCDPATLVSLTSIPDPIGLDQHILGHIQYCDRFGNLVTTIPAQWLDDRPWFVMVHQQIIPGCLAYGDVPLGMPLALVGSHGWVEVAIHCDNAQSQLKLKVTDPVHLWFGNAYATA